MTRDEILDEYEALWRQAMVEGRGQNDYTTTNQTPIIAGPNGTCAWLIADRTLQNRADTPMGWRCCVPGCDRHTSGMANAMIHLNNFHHWTWDMFANKFRAALAQGETA